MTEQPTLFDVAQAETERDDALARVEAHAHTAWLAAAEDALRLVMRTHAEAFTTDDVWRVLDARHVTRPHEPRALGAVLRRAAVAGAIEKTGRTIKSTQVSNHRRDIAVWRRAQA